MKILLIEPGYGAFPVAPWSPWGKMQLAAYLRKHGKHDVRIMDNAFWKGNDNGIRGTVDLEVKPDVIGIGGMTLQLADTLRIASVIRNMYANDPQVRNGKKRVPLIVAGGVHFTFCPNDAYQLFDLVVVGEGERTFLDVCQRFQDTGSYAGESYKDIAGIGYKQPNNGDSFTLTPARSLLDAGEICAPAFDLIPWLTQYDDGFITGVKAPMLMTGRGCPYDCEFCAAPGLYQRKVRLFPMEMVKEIMEQLTKVYGKSDCRIMDDTFAVSNQRVEEFCAMTMENFGPNPMSCLTHCKTADLNTLRTMEDAGFWVVAYGVESGNDEILKLINKKVTVAEAAHAFEITHKAELIVEGLYMMGLIGDTEKTIQDTIDFAKKYNHPKLYVDKPPFAPNWFQFATPFPGSRFFSHHAEYGTLVTKNYNEYHHQKPVFIPHGLTAEKLVAMRKRAFEEVK